MKLRDVLPHEFFGQFADTRAAKMLDVEIAETHSLMNDDVPYQRWPGPEKNVMSWWKLQDGRAVGWNENPGRGWSFPVHGRKSK